MSESLQISRQGRVLHLALNRPDRRNALNMELCSALAAALDDAENDASVGAVLLSGNGKSFCAGMDLHEVLAPGGADINDSPRANFYGRPAHDQAAGGRRARRGAGRRDRTGGELPYRGGGGGCHLRADRNPHRIVAVRDLSNSGGGARPAAHHRIGSDR